MEFGPSRAENRRLAMPPATCLGSRKEHCCVRSRMSAEATCNRCTTDVRGCLDGTRSRSSRPRICLGGRVCPNGLPLIHTGRLRASTAAPKASRDDEIAFSSGDSNIFAVAADGASPRRITFGPEFVTQPDWSPDRRRLVFIRRDSPRDSGHVMVVNRDGTGLSQLTTGEGSFWDAVWSPDGRDSVRTVSYGVFR